MLTGEEKQKIRNDGLSAIASYLWGIDVLFPPCAPALACVYALEMSDNTVKIGVTRNLDERIKAVAGAVYLDVLNVHSTGFAPFGFMRTVESRCHAAFSDKRVRGEFFNITFAEACAELDSHAEEIAAAFKAADEKFLDEVKYFEELKAERSGGKDEPKFEFTDEQLNILCDRFEAITNILKEIKAVREETVRLQKENAILQERNAILQEQNSNLQQENAIIKPKADFVDAVLESDELIDIDLIALDYGFSGQTFNQILADFQVQYQKGETWELQQRYSGKGYAQLNSNGELAWTQRGRHFLYEFLKEHGILPVHIRLKIAQGA